MNGRSTIADAGIDDRSRIWIEEFRF